MARKRNQHLAYKGVHPQAGFIRSLNRPKTRDNVPLSMDQALNAGTLFPNYLRDHRVSMDGSGHIYTDSGELLI